MDELPGDGKCEYEGRLDASKLATPYLCGQVAHTSLDCRRFLISTAFGTATVYSKWSAEKAGVSTNCAFSAVSPRPDSEATAEGGGAGDGGDGSLEAEYGGGQQQDIKRRRMVGKQNSGGGAVKFVKI